MIKKVYIAIVFLLIATNVYPEKVGLVLSGGGAKGMAHLGVIKALEDNGIPIDYVTGTSIGAIVGAFYSMGYSPLEMLEIFKSNEFLYWQTGQVQENYIYSYKKKEPTPEFFTIKFNIKDSLIIETHYLPSSIINPIQMNIAFLSLFSQATAAAKGNFDNLFVPFRCIASDVYGKGPVVLNNGNLGDAVRASMTFPFVFKPIEIDDKLLFDGGIYDNFPVTSMKNDFNPDYIIGSSVSSNPTKPSAKDLFLQIENMIMQHTNYSIDEHEGTLINFEFDNVKLLDFYRADDLFKIGYDETVKKIDEIRKDVHEYVDTLELQAKRKAFKESFKDLKFKNIEVRGVNSAQKRYIANSFQENGEHFDMDQLKESYFKLMADSRISEIRPIAVYNEGHDCFDLILDVVLDDPFIFSIGGNISSSVSSQAYFGLTYQTLNPRGWDNNINGHFGKVYNSIQLSSQVDFPRLNLPFYLKLTGNVQRFNFYQGNEPFYEDNLTTYFEQHEQYVNFSAGFPVSMRSRMEGGIGVGQLKDFYYQSPLNFARDMEDESRYILYSAYCRYWVNTLNDKQYADGGKYIDLTGRLVSGNERFRSNNEPNKNINYNRLNWIQVRGKYEQYFPIIDRVTLGITGDVAWSTRELGVNYTASVLQAPAFTPTTHSKYSFNGAFSANQFIAGGLKPMFHINRQLSIRAELYGFLPFRPIKKNIDTGNAYYGDYFSRAEGMAELSIVFRMPFVAVSVFGNYYSSPTKNWNAGFNIGYLLFNKKFLD